MRLESHLRSFFFLMIFSISFRVLVTGSVLPQRSLPVNSIAGKWLRGFSRNRPNSRSNFLAVASLACLVPRIRARVFFCPGNSTLDGAATMLPNPSGPVVGFETFA